MTVNLEKRIERLESLQDRVFGKLDEMHVEFVTLSSKVGNGLTTSTQNHACEIEQLKTSHRKLTDEVALRAKEYEVKQVRLAADICLLENNLAKDVDQLKRCIAHEIKAEGEAFIENLRKYREDERKERYIIEQERRSEMAKLASERKLYIILGAVTLTLGVPLIMRLIDIVLVRM